MVQKLEMRHRGYASLLLLAALLLTCVYSNSIREVKAAVVPRVVSGSINIWSDAVLDAFCAGKGTDGLSPATAHVISDIDIHGITTERFAFGMNGTTRYVIIEHVNVAGEHCIGFQLVNCINFVIRSCSASHLVMAGIYLEGCMNGTLQDVSITDNEVEGISIIGGQNITIENSTITGNHPYSPTPIDDLRGGIAMQSAWNCTIRFNTIGNNKHHEIWLDEMSHDNEIYNNTIKINPEGAILDSGTNNYVHDNQMVESLGPPALLQLLGVDILWTLFWFMFFVIGPVWTVLRFKYTRNHVPYDLQGIGSGILGIVEGGTFLILTLSGFVFPANNIVGLADLLSPGFESDRVFVSLLVIGLACIALLLGIKDRRGDFHKKIEIQKMVKETTQEPSDDDSGLTFIQSN